MHNNLMEMEYREIMTTPFKLVGIAMEDVLQADHEVLEENIRKEVFPMNPYEVPYLDVMYG